jgi:hypothetical protein
VICVYCEEPMEPRLDGIRSHFWCEQRYGQGPSDDFMPGEDGYARQRAWDAGNPKPAFDEAREQGPPTRADYAAMDRDEEGQP